MELQCDYIADPIPEVKWSANGTPLGDIEDDSIQVSVSQQTKFLSSFIPACSYLLLKLNLVNE